LENSDDASSLLKTNYKVFEKKRVKIFVRGFRGVSPLNILIDFSFRSYIIKRQTKIKYKLYRGGYGKEI